MEVKIGSYRAYSDADNAKRNLDQMLSEGWELLSHQVIVEPGDSEPAIWYTFKRSRRNWSWVRRTITEDARADWDMADLEKSLTDHLDKGWKIESVVPIASSSVERDDLTESYSTTLLILFSREY